MCENINEINQRLIRTIMLTHKSNKDARGANGSPFSTQIQAGTGGNVRAKCTLGHTGMNTVIKCSSQSQARLNGQKFSIS